MPSSPTHLFDSQVIYWPRLFSPASAQFKEGGSAFFRSADRVILRLEFNGLYIYTGNLTDEADVDPLAGRGEIFLEGVSGFP